MIKLAKNKLNVFLVKYFSTLKSQKFILFLGPPGSGNGTFSTMLCRDLNLTRIAINEELSKLLRKESNLAIDQNLNLETLSVITKGKIVQNDLGIQIIKEKLKEKNSKNGVTIGGFPRNMGQVEIYNTHFPVTLAIYLEVDESIIMERLLGRRICLPCKKSYNLCEIKRNGYELDSIMPVVEGYCDNCNQKLTMRPDDTIETIYSRLYNFRKSGYQVVNYYKQNAKVFEFSPKKGIKDYPLFFSEVKKLI